jgi:hypothetical protein
VCSDTHVRYRHAIMSRRNAAILAVLRGVLFLDGLDISLVGVALASLASGMTSSGTLLTGARFLEGAASASSDPVDSVPRVAIGERGETQWT